MKVEVEIGNQYRDGDGCKVQIMRKSEADDDHPFVGYVFSKDVDGRVRTYGLNGNYDVNGSEDSFDLVEEWKEPKISEGWVNVFGDFIGDTRTTKKSAVETGELLGDKIALLHLTYNYDNDTASVEVIAA